MGGGGGIEEGQKIHVFFLEVLNMTWSDFYTHLTSLFNHNTGQYDNDNFTAFSLYTVKHLDHVDGEGSHAKAHSHLLYSTNFPNNERLFPQRQASTYLTAIDSTTSDYRVQ